MKKKGSQEPTNPKDTNNSKEDEVITEPEKPNDHESQDDDETFG